MLWTIRCKILVCVLGFAFGAGAQTPAKTPQEEPASTQPPTAESSSDEECNPACQLAKVRLIPGAGGIGGVAVSKDVIMVLPSGSELGVARPSAQELQKFSPGLQLRMQELVR